MKFQGRFKDVRDNLLSSHAESVEIVESYNHLFIFRNIFFTMSLFCAAKYKYEFETA